MCDVPLLAFGALLIKMHCKDKGGEKLDETEENQLEHRTDGTDAFDTLYIGTEKFPYREIYPITSSGIL